MQRSAVRMGAWTARSAASGCTPRASTSSPGAAPAAAPLADVLAPALRGGVDLVQLREKDAGDGGDPRGRRRGPRALRRRRARCCSSTTGPTSRSPPAPTASTSGRTTWRSREARAVVGPELIVGLLDPRARGDRRGGRGLHRRRARCTRRPRSPGAPRSASTSCATPPSTPSCRGSRSAASTRSSVGAVVDAGATRIAVVRAITDADRPRGGRAARCAPRSRERWPMAARSRKARPRAGDPAAGPRSRTRRSPSATGRAPSGATRRSAPGSSRSRPASGPTSVTVAASSRSPWPCSTSPPRSPAARSPATRATRRSSPSSPTGILVVVGDRDVAPQVLGGARLRDRPRPADRRDVARARVRGRPARRAAAPRPRRRPRDAVLEARPGDGAHADAGGATRTQRVQ